MSVIDTSRFPFVSITEMRNLYSVLAVGDTDSHFSLFLCFLLSSAHVLYLMCPSRFSFNNMNYLSASYFSSSDISFARLGWKFYLSCNCLNCLMTELEWSDIV